MSQACVSADKCDWPQCECAAPSYPWLARKHGIARQEWERRFAARITDKARAPDGEDPLSDEFLAQITASELESWPVDGDKHNGAEWMLTQPEEAADEQMSNWDADE